MFQLILPALFLMFPQYSKNYVHNTWLYSYSYSFRRTLGRGVCACTVLRIQTFIQATRWTSPQTRNRPAPGPPPSRRPCPISRNERRGRPASSTSPPPLMGMSWRTTCSAEQRSTTWVRASTAILCHLPLCPTRLQEEKRKMMGQHLHGVVRLIISFTSSSSGFRWLHF